MKIVDDAVANRQFTLILVLLFTVLGAMSFRSMPRSEDPIFDLPMVTVVAAFPGADPEVIEALVVDPIEEEIRELDDLEVLESTIEDGVAVISAEMLTGVDPDDAYDDVQTKVDGIRDEMPAELQTLDVVKPSLEDVTVLQLALVSPTPQYGLLGRAAEDAERILDRVPGVKRVETWAYPDPEVRVSLLHERLRELGISLDQVAAAIQTAGLDIPGGEVDAGVRRYNVRTSGDFESLNQIRDAIIPGVPGERLLRVGDVARVDMDFEDEDHRGRFNGQPAVFVTVIQRGGTNIFQVLDAVHATLPAVEAALPAGVAMETVFDQSESVGQRIGGFFDSLVQGIALVGLIMLVFLGWRPAVLVVITIPMAILFALAGVDLTGFGLQQMTIVGLVIALGLLVDDAIVVAENIGRFLRAGASPKEAAIRGTAEVAWPSTAGTVTTILAFVPMMAIPSGTGSYIRSLPVTVVYALAASLAISLTFTPLLASWLLKRGAVEEETEPATASVRSGTRLQRILGDASDGPYARLLGWSLDRPFRVLGLAGATLALSFLLFPLVGVSLFPKAEKPQFLVDIEAPEGTSLNATDDIVRSVEALVATQPAVRRYAANVGRDNPQVYYNIPPRREKTNIGQIFVELDGYAAAERVVANLKRAFTRVPGARVTITEFENGPPVEAPIAFKVIGPDLDTLDVLAARIENLLLATEGTENVRNPLGDRKTDLQVRVDRDKASLLGLDLATIDRTVRASLAGLPVSTYRDPEGEEYEVVLRLPLASGRPNPTDLERINVAGPSGAQVPLTHVAGLQLVPGLGRVDRYNAERVATITAYPSGDASVFDITNAVSERLASEDWPEGYGWFASGQFEEQQEGFARMAQALVFAILGIFAVLVLQFRSFVQPLIIFVSVPLSFVGAVLGLLLTGYTFSFTAFIGTTSLVGIVINNSIILVEYANRMVDDGATKREAVLAAGKVRFTPIVLTTLTTIGGLLPLTLTGSQMWSPLGWVIIGGLLVSTVLTLVVVPVLYRLAPARATADAEAGVPEAPDGFGDLAPVAG